MAKYLQGINGAFTGKVGSVVGCILNGTAYMRGKPRPRTGPIGETEQRNRNKFATMHAWLKPLIVILRAGFKDPFTNAPAYNSAKSYNLKNAMADGAVVPELVKLSMGDLPLSEDLTATLTDDNKLLFQWNPNYLEGGNRKDQIMVLAYHPESKRAFYELHGAFRETGTQELKLFNEFAGKTIHVYAAFFAADRNRQSESVYLGAIDC
jgi:hypothetical protein